MADVVIGALRACGRTVRLLDMVPTPTVQLMVEGSDAAGGIAITASHNPAEWNGLKFVGADGVFLSPDECARLWAMADAPPTSLLTTQQSGIVEYHSEAITEHIHQVRQLDMVKGAPVRHGEVVVVDAVNCSGSRIVPQLLQRLGFSVVGINCDGSGIFKHPPEPVPENLGALSLAVQSYSAAFGVAVDPDADTQSVLETLGLRSTAPSVVVNYSTTRMVDHVASLFGATVHRSPVGEINVVRRMQELGAVIGGEGSGGVIYPACHSGRDAIVGLALIVSLLRRHQLSLREACDAIPAYAMVKAKATTPAAFNKEAFFAQCRQFFPDASVSEEDGLYLSWPDRWLHVRTSNTEPIVRFIGEAHAESTVHGMISTIKQLFPA
jgi:phosphomannomutase